jgi:Ca2+-binding EF-hand superfamily protein
MMPPGYGMGGGMGPGMGVDPGMGMGPGMGPGMGMAAIDGDQDGSISAEEAAAHAEFMFEAMDADQDGALVADEMGGGRMDMMRRMNPAMSEGMQERHAAQFALKDADSDGKVTMAEFLAAEKAQYDAADADGDGKVTPWELRGQMWQ